MGVASRLAPGVDEASASTPGEMSGSVWGVGAGVCRCGGAVGGARGVGAKEVRGLWGEEGTGGGSGCVGDGTDEG